MHNRACRTLLIIGLMGSLVRADDAGPPQAIREPLVTFTNVRAGGSPAHAGRTVARRVGTLGQFFREDLDRAKDPTPMPAAEKTDLDRIETKLEAAEVWVIYDAPPEGSDFRTVPEFRIETRGLDHVIQKEMIQSIEGKQTLLVVNDNLIDISFLAELKLANGCLRISDDKNPAFGTKYNIVKHTTVRPEKPGLYGVAEAAPTTRPTP